LWNSYEGAISAKRVDESVRRILRSKRWSRLLDSPYPDASRRRPFPRQTHATRSAARESITLLENDGTLPLRKRAILVTGPGRNR
jgi:beta-glucosidase